MDTDALIAAVYKRTALWDKTDENHTKRNVIERCWKEISEELDVDEVKLRKKWKYLRDQFTVELGKVTKNHTNEEDKNTTLQSRWIHFKPLIFLKEVAKPRTINPTPASKVVSSTSTKIQSSDVIEINDDPLEPIIKREIVNDEEDSQSGEDAQPLSNLYLESTLVPQRKRKSRKDDVLSSDEEDYVMEKSKRQNESDDDEHLHFFNSLLPHIRRIPQFQLLSFRSRIQDLVEQYAYPSK